MGRTTGRRPVTPAREAALTDPEAIHPQAAVAPGYLANHAARVFDRQVDAALRPHGLSLPLIGPLLLLGWKGPMRQRDLVASSAVRQPAMVALLDKLERAGWVARAPDPQDRRAAIVSLTPAGADMARIGGAALHAVNARGTDPLSADEAATLVSLLRRFIGGLESGT